MSWTADANALADLVKNRDSGSEKELQDPWGGVNGLAETLKTDLKTGLSKQEIDSGLHARREHFGTNVLPTPPPRSYFSFFWAAIQDKTLIILMVAAVVSIGLATGFPNEKAGETRGTAWIEGVAILIAVAIVSNVTAANDFSKDKRFRQLSAIVDDRKVKVIRAGEQQVISISEVLVGDIVALETGDFIPSDMIYISGQSLHSDESALTGEPDAVRKSKSDPWLLSGCTITEGVGRGIVIATGVNSQWGRIKTLVDKEERKTPLQEKLEDLAENIGKAGLVAASLTFVAMILRWTIRDYGVDKIKWKWSHLNNLVHAVITAITIIVVAVPEGLPLAVTLALAFSMFKMMKDQNLVRHLVACETMGGATNICSDKTGTLTQNRMTVVKLIAGEQMVEDQPKDKSLFNPSVLNTLNEGICINSNAYIQKRNSEKPEFIGAKTECALLVMCDNLGTDYERVRSDLEVERMYPFSSKKKNMITIVRGDKGFRLYCKGASEVILDLCSEMLDRDGQRKELSSTEKKRLLTIIEDWASQGLRTLTMAYADLSPDTEIPPEGECPFDHDLILVGIVGIQDPLRPEVPNSVAQCQRAGITVRMLTGDNLLTAKNIGKQCGILTNGEAIEGPHFRKLTPEQMDKLIPRLQIIARCSPEDKLVLVKRLVELGEVVAVTGDGTNDAPALREADVGFAMGISGTEVAKDACDIILLDDNFSSIEKAVMWGRGVYDSIKKFLQFQLTVNVVAVLIAFVGAVSQGDSPLKPIQLLWVNLIMDTMAALALATERPGPELLNRPPHGRNSPLITWTMWRMILGQAAYQMFILLFLMYGIQHIKFLDCTSSEHDERKRSSIIFNTFVWMQFFNEVNCRKLGNEKNIFSKFHKSYVFQGVLVFTAIVQFLLVQFGDDFSKTVPLNVETWFFCIALGVVAMPLGFLLRLIPVPDDYTPRDMDMGAKGGEEEQLLLSDGEANDHKQERRPSDSAVDSKDAVELEILREKRTASGNWDVAKQVLTQVRVVQAFRRAAPGVRY